MGEEDPWAVFDGRFRARLCQYLRRKYPRLADQVEDMLQTAIVQAMVQRRTSPWTAEELARWLHVATNHRALDCLRGMERNMLRQMSGQGSSRWPLELAGVEDRPSRQVAEQQRRGHQGLVLSEVLAGFCRWCESRPQGCKMKEMYERSLRGQGPQDIASALGVSRASVDTTLSRARQWVLDRVRQADVDQSVFLTLHRRLPPAGGAAGDEPPVAKPAAIVPGALPELYSFGDVVRWVIEELGAMCPSSERLAAYWADADAPELQDIRYHVEEAACSLCGVERAAGL